MTDVKNILWDTCVLYRWLTKHPPEYVDHIAAHVADAEAGRSKIFISSIGLAELRPSRVKASGDTPASIMNRLCAFITVVDTIPDIMSVAGSLKDNRYVCSTDDPKAKERARELSTGDAVHLATAIWMREYAGVQDLEFHTFDDGKSRNAVDGKTVPMISFHNWCKGLDGVEHVELAKEIRRKKPDHHSCQIPTKKPN